MAKIEGRAFYMLKVLASSVRRFLSIFWSINGTRLAQLAKRQSLHGEGFVVGKNVWSAPTKLGKDGHYRDSLPRQRARSYHQYWPTSPSRSFAECVRNVMIRVLMDTQTCSKSAAQMHIKLTQSITEWHKQRNNWKVRFCNQERLIMSFSAMSAAKPFVRRGFNSINTIAFAWFIELTV